MNVLEFKDYRLFLRAFIKTLPRKGHGAINRMALHLGVHSSLISQILAEKKEFNLEQAHSLAAFIGLNPLETDYFILLVEKERAGTKSLRDYFTAKLEKVKKDSLQISSRIPQDRELTDHEQSVFYSNWLYSAIRLWTSIGPGKNLEEIAERFSLSRPKAAEIMQFLLEIRLCIEENGLYKMGPQRLHLDRKSPFVTRLHSNWRIKAIQHSDHLQESEMMFTAPLSISRKDFESIREQIVALIKSVSEKVVASEPEEIACLNIDWLWID